MDNFHRWDELEKNILFINELSLIIPILIFNLKDVKYEPYPAIEYPFSAQMKNGLVKELFVSKDMRVQEENIIKGMLSAIQYDISNGNLVDKRNTFINDDKTNGVYRKMETDVTGMCNVSFVFV